MASSAPSISASPTSRCVTARSTDGWMVADRATPCSASTRIASSFESGATSSWTKFVSTRSGSTAEARVGEPEREPLGACVVVGEPFDVVIEGVDTRRGDDSRLTHGAAEEVLHAAGIRHHLGRAGKQRAEWAAETLRETERDGVETAADRRGLLAAADRGVQQPGAVEVKAKPELVAEAAELVDLLQRPDSPAARVVRVLDPDDAGARRVDHRRPVCGTNLLDAEPAGGAGKPSRDDTRVDRRGRRAPR